MPAKKSKNKTKISRKSKNGPGNQDRALFSRVKRGDAAAGREMLDKHASWVVNLARKYHALFPQLSVSELEAEGNRGLVEALGRFNPAKKAKFSTYAWFWIMKNIQNYITASFSMINVPAKAASKIRKLMDSINNEIKKGKDPDLAAISGKLGVEYSVARELLSDKKNVISPVSMDRYVDNEERGETYADLLENKNETSIQDMAGRSEDEKMIEKYIGRLSPVEQNVLTLLFGVGGSRPVSIEHAAKQLKITSVKIRDIRKIALLKLKMIMRETEDA
ncbi:MAG: sigma-70 family RNA polymerase sigma factor [Endomicrobiales bacterium]|nr:sigma-70 family RNA polymerase sigma factor [Endomicrobiales bacterium]